MATLTDPIRLQNIIDRFSDYVVATANLNIVWGTNNKPFPEMPDFYFGGTTAGQGATILSGAGSTGRVITAIDIYNAALSETHRYSNLRNMNAALFVTSTAPTVVNGVNTWNKVTAGAPRSGVAGTIFAAVRKAHNDVSSRLYPALPGGAGLVSTDNIIYRSALEDLFYRLTILLLNLPNRDVTIIVCHGSCHSNCHNSRSRR